MSGGMWVFTPSQKLVDRINALISAPVPGTSDGWLFGDMQVVLYMFGRIDAPISNYREWPLSRDLRQGVVPGLRILPAYTNETDEVLERELLQNGRRAPSMPPEGVLREEAERAAAEGKTTWKMLDPRYDGLVGNCECVPERDLGTRYYSVHFTCLPVTPPVHKPGRYENEDEFLLHVRTRMFGCMRYYFLRWYDAYARGMNDRLPEPYYDGPEVRIADNDADAETARNRQEAFDAAVAAEKLRNEARDRGQY